MTKQLVIYTNQIMKQKTEAKWNDRQLEIRQLLSHKRTLLDTTKQQPWNQLQGTRLHPRLILMKVTQKERDLPNPYPNENH